VIIDDGDFTLDGQAFITRGYIRQKISWEPPPRQWVLTRWDIATGRVLGTIRNIATSYASISVSILPEGETVAVVKGKTIEFWNLLTGKLQRIWKEFDPKATSLSMKLLPDGTMLCIQVYSEKHQVVKTAVQLRDVSTGKVSQRWTRIGYLSLAEFSPDAKYFLSDDGVHRVQDGTRVGPEPGNGLRVPIRAIAFSAQGDKIACALQIEVVIWDIAHGKMQWLRWPTDKTMKFPEVMTSVAFSPDGRWLAAGGGADIEPNPQGVARMWDVATGKFLRVVAQRPEIITDVRFLPDGKTLACSSGRQTEYFSQGEVSLWNVQSGRLDSTLLQRELFNHFA
jgi:WD40 repeat protein